MIVLQSLEEWLRSIFAEKDTLLFAIMDARTRTPVGVAGYLRITPKDGVVEVGHVHFSKQLQKTPAATEAMFLMMQHAFDDLKYRRYEWKCDSMKQECRKIVYNICKHAKCDIDIPHKNTSLQRCNHCCIMGHAGKA